MSSSIDSSSKQRQSGSGSGNEASLHVSKHAAESQGAKHSPSTKKPQQQQPVLDAAADTRGSSSSNSGSSGRRRRWLLLHQRQQQPPHQAAAAHSLLPSSKFSGSSGRQLKLQSPDFSADMDSARLMTHGGKSSNTDGLEKASASSSSKGRVACWRLVHMWPFGEDGRVWGFNQAGDGLFITSSISRCVQCLACAPAKGVCTHKWRKYVLMLTEGNSVVKVLSLLCFDHMVLSIKVSLWLSASG
jgi:hypothetical protein